MRTAGYPPASMAPTPRPVTTRAQHIQVMFIAEAWNVAPMIEIMTPSIMAVMRPDLSAMEPPRSAPMREPP